MASTIFQLNDAGALPRIDWLHVDSGATGGTDGKIAIIQAPAGSEDADGNPTPDTATYAPADFPQGSLFYSTSLPATLNSGADTVGGGTMTFRRTGASGSEVWTWIQGSFRASNSNGNYVRNADGGQECSGQATVDTFSSSNAILEDNLPWPASFVDSNARGSVNLVSFVGVAPADVTMTQMDTITSSDFRLVVRSGTNGLTTGDSVVVDWTATGAWE